MFSLDVATRNATLNAIVTRLGGSATMTFYNGSKPSALGAPGGTSLAVLTFGSTAVTDANSGTAGSVTGGVLTFGGFTQTPTNFTDGTPTFVRLARSDGTAISDIDIGAGAGNLQFTGTVKKNWGLSGTLTLTAGDAAT